MTTNRFPITIYINENSEHEAEDIFDSIQLLLADEFGGEAEAFFGAPDELIDGSEFWNENLKKLASRPTSEFSTEEIAKLLKALVSDAPTDDGEAN